MMEVLQCDGCDFRAESYDDLKSHIQEVHTAFLQPADADESDSVKDEDEEDEEEESKDKDDADETPPKTGLSTPLLIHFFPKVDPLLFHALSSFR